MPAPAVEVNPDVDQTWFFRHDIFNLLCLPGLIYLNINVFINWNFESYSFYTQVFVLYIFLDTIWVALIPRSVPSSIPIIVHHIASIAGLLSVYYLGRNYPDYIVIVLSGGLLEINTFFLLARRNFRDSIIPTVLFFGSWITLRLMMGPWVLYKTIELFQSHYDRFQNTPMLLLQASIIIIVTVSLNILNYKWTYDLLMKQFFRKEKTSKGV